MKRKLTISFLLCLVLICSIILSACGSGNITDAKEVSILDILAEEPDGKTQVSSLNALTINGNFVSGDGNFFYARKDDGTSVVYTVYDIRNFNAVYTYTNNSQDEYSFHSFDFYDGAEFFTLSLVKQSEFKTSLIYKDGTVVATENHEAEINGSEYLFESFGLFTFDNDAYRQTDSGIKLIRKSEHGFTTFNDDDIVICGEKYFWTDSFSNASIKHYVAYDTELNPVTEYKFPTYAVNTAIFKLSKDRVLIQYLVVVDSHSVDYALTMNGTKYNIYQYVYNTEAKSETRIDLKGLVVGIMDVSKESSIKKNRVSSLASILPIRDKNLDTNGDLYNINENGSIVEKFITPNDLDLYNVTVLAKNRYSLQNAYVGASQIIDKSGKVYGSYDNYDDVSETFTNDAVINDSFIIIDEVIYDFDFNKIYDIKNEDEVYLAQSSIYVKTYINGTDYYDAYLLKAGSKVLEKICSYTESENAKLVLDSTSFADKKIYEFVYVVKAQTDSGTTFSYYTENGKLLMQGDKDLAVLYMDVENETVILSCEGANGVEYYAIK